MAWGSKTNLWGDYEVTYTGSNPHKDIPHKKVSVQPTNIQTKRGCVLSRVLWYGFAGDCI